MRKRVSPGEKRLVPAGLRHAEPLGRLHRWTGRLPCLRLKEDRKLEEKAWLKDQPCWETARVFVL